jgi:hypothetical protein
VRLGAGVRETIDRLTHGRAAPSPL